MSAIFAAAPELLVLLPLSIAAGVDLYLTLLFLGAATTSTWWSDPLPGALGDLDSLAVLLVVGGFYLLEFAAERFPAAALFWNAFHAVIRPVSGALLALLLLEGHPLSIVAPGALLAGATASLAHAVRTGDIVLRWLSDIRTPHPLLISIAEDVLAVALVVLVIDLPLWAAGAAGVVAVSSLVFAGSRVRAFVFAIRLGVGRVFQTLGAPRWTEPQGFPSWVRGALAHDVMAPGGGLRGSRAAAARLPGAPSFATGWVVVTGDAPVFVFRGPKGVRMVDLEGRRAASVSEMDFFRRVDLGEADQPQAALLFGLAGPGVESLKAEFMPA